MTDLSEYTVPENTIFPFQNGRVIDVNDKNYKYTTAWENISEKKENNFENELMMGIYTPNVLNTAYFSRENLDIVQNMIRYRIFKKSNEKFKISRQSDLDVIVIMRSMFLQHSPNLSCHIKEQIAYLNDLTVEWIIPRVYSEIEQHIGYINNVEFLPTPIGRPLNLSSKGERTLKSVTTTF